MKIKVVSVPVHDQEEALKFYTEKAGFVKKRDIPLGGGNRWLTLISKDDPDGPELLLEPAPVHFEPAKAFQEALFESGMPWMQFYVESVEKEYERLQKAGVAFSVNPTNVGSAIIAVFNDTCGNYIQLVEEL